MPFQSKTHCKNGHELTEENIRWSLKEGGKRRRVCRICNNEYHRKRAARLRLENPDKIRTYERTCKLRQKYGWTPEQWQAKFDEQGGHCAGCGIAFSETIVPCVDHNHETKVNRGLLCHACNRGLGLLKE